MNHLSFIRAFLLVAIAFGVVSNEICMKIFNSSSLLSWRVAHIICDMTEMHSPVTPGRVAQSVGHLTRKSEVLGSIPGLATYFRFSFR